MMFKKCNVVTSVVAILVSIYICIANGISVPNRFSPSVFFISGNVDYIKNIHSNYNPLGFSQQNFIDTFNTVENTGVAEKNWQSFAAMPTWTPNAAIQCNFKRFINNSVLITFSSTVAQISKGIPELHRFFNLVNLPRAFAEKIFVTAWKDFLSRYGIPHDGDISESLSKNIFGAYEGFSPEEYQCGIGQVYGLPLLKAGILTADNVNSFAFQLVHFMYTSVKNANPTDFLDVYTRYLEGVELFFKMVGINMVEELPKMLLNGSYLARFYGK